MGINPGRPPPKATTPATGASPPPKRWTFSFRFWREIRHFGLEAAQTKWFVSWLTKLQELSKYEVEAFLTNGPMRKAWRYHEIDWNARSVPIARTDCDWVDSDYLNNEVEFPFVQFQVSQALGRVVGFWDENKVFNVILLDPLHNIQPSNFTNYTVRPTKPLGCEFTDLLLQVDSLRKEMVCEKVPCPARELFAEAARPKPHAEAIVIGVSSEEIQTLRTLLATIPGLNLNNILLAGVAQFQGAPGTKVSAGSTGSTEPKLG